MTVTCRVQPRKNGTSCDARVTEDGGKSRLVNTFLVNTFNAETDCAAAVAVVRLLEPRRTSNADLDGGLSLRTGSKIKRCR